MDSDNELSKNIKRFLTRIQVRKRSEDKFGMTWIELYVLYRSMGYECPVRDPENKAAVKPAVGKQLQTFKLAFKRVVKKLPEDTKEVFAPAVKKGYVLRRLGIKSHCAATRAEVKLDKESRRHLDKELLRLKGSRRSDVEEESRGEKEVEEAKLSLKRKPAGAKMSKSSLKRSSRTCRRKNFQKPTVTGKKRVTGRSARKRKRT